MNVSEFIVKYLKSKNIIHFFGYQGTMITYFVDAIGVESGVFNHSFYNEQGAALAACGCAKSSGGLACAYSTSGPGAINLLQGIADAYYDSVPVVFITGQLNLSEYTQVKELRQQGFQETNIIDITKTLTKFNCFVNRPQDIVEVLPKAVKIALSGRRGPVLLDIPMDVQRSEIALPEESIYHIINSVTFDDGSVCKQLVSDVAKTIIRELEDSQRPVFLLGNGIHRDEKSRKILNEVLKRLGIPVLSGLMSKDMVYEESNLYFGFVGSSYGQRSGNIIASKKADLIISLGCRLCTRLTGVKQTEFAKDAKLIRIEIDPSELDRKVHEDEMSFNVDVNDVLRELINYKVNKSFVEWNDVCKKIKKITDDFDDKCVTRLPNNFVQAIADSFPQPLIAVADVGQNMMWVANSFKIRQGQELLFSGAHGAMGFALPASIGAYYASPKSILCFTGDGGFQMNIQELQYVFRDNIPLKIFVFNNNSLGMITQVQDDYLGGRRTGTDESGGFTSPCFADLATAYGIKSFKTDDLAELRTILEIIKEINDKPVLVEILFNEQTYAHPKTYFGEEISNQRPYLPADVYSQIMNL